MRINYRRRILSLQAGNNANHTIIQNLQSCGETLHNEHQSLNNHPTVERTYQIGAALNDIEIKEKVGSFCRIILRHNISP